MRDQNQLMTFASAAVLTLTLNQFVFAAEGETIPAETAPAATEAAVPAETPAASTEAEVTSAPTHPIEASAPAVPAAPTIPAAPTPAAIAPTEATVPPTPAEIARQRSEQRRAVAMEQRGLRYEELRQRAAKSGVELPETPPWEQIEPPERPDFPTSSVNIPGNGMMSADERAAQIEKMRNMTPEERMAEREAHWAEMRERAAERGIELPETPPWKAAMERRKAIQEKWAAYRKTVEEMSDEQREAAQAMFGQPAPTGGPATFRGQPFPGAGSRGVAPGRFGPPAMSSGSYGPCGPMPCQGHPGRNMGPRPPMMYPQGIPGGAQAPMRPMRGGY